MSNFTLQNAVLSHAEHPETFEIPSPQDLAVLAPGDFVFLIFIPNRRQEGEAGGERMWVRVTHNNGHEDWAGTLDNFPITESLSLDLGDEIIFSWEHIAGYQLDRSRK